MPAKNSETLPHAAAASNPPPAAATPPATHPSASQAFPGFDDSFTHRFQLPSRGIPYVDANGAPLLPDDGAVVVRMMTGEEEAILNSDAYNDQAKIAKIVTACTRAVTVDGKTLNVENMISTDRLMLILYIRAHSLGSVYKLPGVCANRNCGCEFEHQFDLIADLDVEQMPRKHTRKKKVTDPNTGEVIAVPYEETLTYDPRGGIVIESLPTTNYGVKLRLLTGRDEDWIAREVAKGVKGALKLRQSGDPSFYLRMARMISALCVPGKDWQSIIPESARDIAEVCQFIQKLPIKDINAISRAYIDHDVGISNTVSTTCPSCGADVVIPFRILGEFFRPTVGDE